MKKVFLIVLTALMLVTISSAVTLKIIQPDGSVTMTRPEGSEITLSDSSGQIKWWKVISGAINIINNKFIMPSENVEIEPQYSGNVISVEQPTSGGIITPGTTGVTSGSSKTFYIKPNTGYKVQNVIVDGSGLGEIASNNCTQSSMCTNCYGLGQSCGTCSGKGYTTACSHNIYGPHTSYTFNNITSNHVITATFTEANYVVTVNTQGNGTVVGAGGYEIGRNVQLTATPGTGYTFGGWEVVSGDVVLSSANQNVTNFTMPAGNVVVKAVFNISSYSVTAITSPAEGGTINDDGVGEKVYGSTVTLTTTVNEGYTFVGWKITNGSTVLTSTIDTTTHFIMPAGNVTVQATYSANPYILTVNPGGTVHEQGYQTEQKITAPKESYLVTFNYNDGVTGSTSELSNREFTSWTLTGAGSISDATAKTTIYTYGAGLGILTANYSSTGNAISLPSVSERDGYTFIGWYTSITGGTKVGDAGSSFSPSGNITLYARWSKNGNLPEEYEQIEYIESTGTQYIDTGYLPKTNTKLELTVSFNGEFKDQHTYGVGGRIFGTVNGDNSFSMNFGSKPEYADRMYIWNDKTFESGASKQILKNIEGNILYAKNTIILENSKVTYGTYSMDLTPKSENHTTVTLQVFGHTSEPFGGYNMRVYELILSEENNVVRHLIPCINPSGEAGLYDTVIHQFFGNSGTGRFNTPCNEPTGIGNGLTPVRWTGSAWIEATDTEIANGTWKTWYNYETANDENGNLVETLANGDKTAMWANAVTEDGSQWVWIPRYSYKIVNGYNNSGTSWNNGGGASGNKIEIIFSNGTRDTNEPGYTPHPAFDFGGDVTGIWVAKYEMSAETNGVASQPGDILTSANPTVKMVSKVGRTSWRNICVSKMFDNTLAYNPDLESHMMKNVEWGAVAYLSNAIGRIPAISSSYVSGAGGVTTSTTGNEYGIYDMSGGTYEYVATYLDYNALTSNYLGNDINREYAYSLYENRNTKYVDVYEPNSNNYAWTASEIGDAVYETSDSYTGNTSWDGDCSVAPDFSHPIFDRGGIFYSDSSAGAFYFGWNSGNARDNAGFRAVLVP